MKKKVTEDLIKQAKAMDDADISLAKISKALQIGYATLGKIKQGEWTLEGYDRVNAEYNARRKNTKWSLEVEETDAAEVEEETPEPETPKAEDKPSEPKSELQLLTDEIHLVGKVLYKIYETLQAQVDLDRDRYEDQKAYHAKRAMENEEYRKRRYF